MRLNSTCADLRKRDRENVGAKKECICGRERDRVRDEAPIMLREAHIINDLCIHL